MWLDPRDVGICKTRTLMEHSLQEGRVASLPGHRELMDKMLHGTAIDAALALSTRTTRNPGQEYA